MSRFPTANVTAHIVYAAKSCVVTQSHCVMPGGVKCTFCLLAGSFQNEDEHGGTRALRGKDSEKVSVGNPSRACHPTGHQNKAPLAFMSESEGLTSVTAHHTTPHRQTDISERYLVTCCCSCFLLASWTSLKTQLLQFCGSDAESHLLLMFSSK